MAYRTSNVSAMGVASPETANARGEWARGWKMVAVALVAYVLGAVGMFFAFGLFLKPLSSEFHWSREAISGFTSISGVMYAVACPFLGRLADRFGMKKVILVCAVLYAVVYASQGFLTGHLWQYYGIAFLMGPAAAGTSALTFGKVISNWFDRSRGMALSILACGSGLGGVLVPPLAQHLISHYGWRRAYFLFALSMLTGGTIPVALVLKDAQLSKTKDTTSPAAEIAAVPRASRSQVLRSYTFITL